MRLAGPRLCWIGRLLAPALLVCVVLIAGLDSALAQPFGAHPPAAPSAGVVAWLFAKQEALYRMLSTLVRATRQDWTALGALFGLSFLYGVLHAAGPGHGKAVISSYLLANRETWRRGVVMSVLAALLQALVAIAAVALLALVLQATARAVRSTVNGLEMASYAGIALMGLWLMVVKGRQVAATWRAFSTPGLAFAGASLSGPSVNFAGPHDLDDLGACACGQTHFVDPALLAGAPDWKKSLSAIVATGLRPCSGAIFVLIFSLAQGVFMVGIGATLMMAAGTALTVAVLASAVVLARDVATRRLGALSPKRMLAYRGAELAAAVCVFVLGALLFTGYLTYGETISF